MHFLQVIISDLSVLIVCNKTGGTIKRRYKKSLLIFELSVKRWVKDVKEKVWYDFNLSL